MVSYLSFVVKLTSGRGHLRRAARRLCADDDDRGAPRDQARPGRLQPVWDEVGTLTFSATCNGGGKSPRHY